MLELAQFTDKLANSQSNFSASAAIEAALNEDKSVGIVWVSFQQQRALARSKMILMQEELDWVLYDAYGLADANLRADVRNGRTLNLKSGNGPSKYLLVATRMALKCHQKCQQSGLKK